MGAAGAEGDVGGEGDSGAEGLEGGSSGRGSSAGSFSRGRWRWKVEGVFGRVVMGASSGIMVLFVKQVHLQKEVGAVMLLVFGALGGRGGTTHRLQM